MSDKLEQIAKAAVADHEQDFSECYDLFTELHDDKKYFIVMPTVNDGVYVDVFGTYYNSSETKNYNKKQFVYNRYITPICSNNYLTASNIKTTITEKVKKIMFLNQEPLTVAELKNVIVNFDENEWNFINDCYIRI